MPYSKLPATVLSGGRWKTPDQQKAETATTEALHHGISPDRGQACIVTFREVRSTGPGADQQSLCLSNALSCF